MSSHLEAPVPELDEVLGAVAAERGGVGGGRGLLTSLILSTDETHLLSTVKVVPLSCREGEGVKGVSGSLYTENLSYTFTCSERYFYGSMK